MNARTSLILRAALAFSLAYPAISALFQPSSWIGYFPSWVLALPIPEMVILHAFGLVEILLAFWLLSGWRIFIPSVLSAVILFLIIVTNPSQFVILFRDVPILLIAVALALHTFSASADQKSASE